jgi:hypothetical protein
MDMDDLPNKEKLLKKHKEYLQVAELQLANFGLTPPISLVLDIGECKSKIADLQREIVNLRNRQRRRDSKVIYKHVDDILTISDTNGEITYRVQITVPDIHMHVLNSSIFEKLIKVIADCLKGNDILVLSDFRGDGIALYGDEHTHSDHREMVNEIRMHMKSLEDRNISISMSTLMFSSEGGIITIIMFDTDSHIGITCRTKEAVSSAYNTLMAFFKSSDLYVSGYL